MTEAHCNQVVTHYGKSHTKFGNLRDVAIGPNKEIIIVDNGNKCVIVLDSEFNLLTVIGKGVGNARLTDPCCVAVSNEIIAISDQIWSHQVKKYTIQGKFISAIGHLGSLNGEFDYPRGLVFNNNNLYVVDGFNHRVQVFQEDDNFAYKFGSKGCDPGEFNFPVRIAIDSRNNVLVSDYDNNSITQFSCTGHFIKVICCIGPWGITVTPDNYLITSHYKVEIKEVLCIYDPSYQLINKFGTKGKLPEQFFHIRGITTDYIGNIFMVDHDNQRLYKFPTYTK